MKRFALAVLFAFACTASADENVSALQTRLRQEGFYFGDPTGQLNDETAAALTRYQIRHGLPITGRLDEPTAKALGVHAMPSPVGDPPRSLQGTWRQLRNGEQEFVPASPAPKASSAPARIQPKRGGEKPIPPPPAATPRPARRAARDAFDPERLRDYVAAFVLAGLDPKIGAELEFFADRVDYFDDGKLSRASIRRDLLRYDSRWPERRFWLAGALETRAESGRRIRVTFPLRYELRSPSERASGTVRKTLVLQKTPANELEIVAVYEKKLK